MNDAQHKKYTVQARTGIKGEAFFEALIADYSLPHHIVGPKDMGIDYICEWVYGDSPTGILYAVQVKTFSEETAKPQFVGVETKLNLLKKYTIANPNLVIDNRTLHYWKGLGMPVYLFAVVQSAATDEKDEHIDCYYERFTPVLTTDAQQKDLFFYKANEGSKFLAFAREKERKQGFARDLFIDYMRWAYYKGSIAYLNPRTLGLNQFDEENAIFVDLFNEYKERVCITYAKTRRFLEESRSFSGKESA